MEDALVRSREDVDAARAWSAGGEVSRAVRVDVAESGHRETELRILLRRRIIDPDPGHPARVGRRVSGQQGHGRQSYRDHHDLRCPPTHSTMQARWFEPVNVRG